jgi:hypothetical protein
MFRFSEISTSISKSKSEFWFRFWFRLFTFDEIDIPTKFHTDFIEISMLKSEFRLWFRCRNRNFDFGAISTSEFRFWFRFQNRNWFWFRFQNRNSDYGKRLQYKCRNSKAFFNAISQNSTLITYQNLDFERRNPNRNSDYFRKFRPIISSKVKINFDRNSDQNFDEINFGGSPSSAPRSLVNICNIRRCNIGNQWLGGYHEGTGGKKGYRTWYQRVKREQVEQVRRRVIKRK